MCLFIDNYLNTSYETSTLINTMKMEEYGKGLYLF